MDKALLLIKQKKLEVYLISRMNCAPDQVRNFVSILASLFFRIIPLRVPFIHLLNYSIQEIFTFIDLSMQNFINI